MSWNKKGENEKNENNENIEKEEDNESPLKNDNMKKGKDKLINNFNINKINNGRNRNNFYPKTGALTFTTDLSTNKLKKKSLFVQKSFYFRC